MSEPREEIMSFALAMERKMEEHDKTRGDSWKEMSTDWLLGRTFEELGEYLEDNWNSGELVDAANFLMFVWSIHNR